MILNDVQQIPSFPQLHCSIHPTEPITDFCGSETCHHRVLCQTCKEAHHSLKQLISAQDLENQKIFSTLEKLGQEEGADNPENILQELENTFAIMKQDLDKAFDAVKTRTFEMVQSKLSRTKSWKTMNSELQEKYNEVFSQPLALAGKALEDFTRDYCSVLKHLEKKEKEPKIVIKPAKNEFVKMLTGIKDTMTKHQDKLAHIEQQSSLVRGKVNLKNIKKEKIISFDYQVGIKPTAIAYLENQDLIAVSGGTDITLWSAKTFTKVQTRPDVHTSKVVSLAYSAKKNTLFSCAWDRTIRLFLINSQGFRGLAKVIAVPPGSSASGIFVLEQKGIFLSYGQGQNIRVWGLNDNKMKGIISTNGMTDMGPNMAYSKKNNMLAAFFHRTGKIGLFAFETRQLLEVLDTKMKQNDIFSEALLFNEKKGLFMASSDFGKLRIWSIKNRKATVLKDIDTKGYCFGMVGFEEEDSVVLVNFLKDLVIVNINQGVIAQTNALGLKNGSSLVHLVNHRKFLVADSLTDKACVLNY